MDDFEDHLCKICAVSLMSTAIVLRTKVHMQDGNIHPTPAPTVDACYTQRTADVRWSSSSKLINQEKYLIALLLHSEYGEHVSGPGCTSKIGYSGIRIRVEEMEVSETCLVVVFTD